jgi:predicted Zn-dependent peptidase
MSTFIPLILCFAYFSHCACAQDTPDTRPERIRLDNGVTLLLAPLPEAKVVAVEMFYPVGFCDEPAGMTQAAHLLEHLMCQGATKSYGPGESSLLFRKLGMANAETLPTFMHFDYTAPPDELKTILKVEGERLTSLKFTPELISDEADKCHEEAQFVYKNPQSGMVKHAFMALFQFWNHGATEVRVRSGVDQLPPDKLEAFYRTMKLPDFDRTIAIVGAFRKDEALALAREHLGNLSIFSYERNRQTVKWDKQPREGAIVWDADVYGICLYAPPPADPIDRTLLSLWGTALMQKLSVRTDLSEIAHMTFASNTTWPVGDLPFFVYATAKSADKIPQIEQLFRDRFRIANIEVESDILLMRIAAHEMGGAPSWNELKVRAAQMAKATERSEDEIMPMVLGNAALQWGLRELNGAAADNDNISEKRLRAVLEKTLDPAKLRIVTLGPPPPTPRDGH